MQNQLHQQGPTLDFSLIFFSLLFLFLNACGGTFIEGASCREDAASLQLLQPLLAEKLTMALDESEQPGLQVTLIVQTNLAANSQLTLSQELPSGVSVLHEFPGIVDVDGVARFEEVTFEEGEIRIRIHAEGQCTWFAYEEEVSVQGTTSCDLNLPVVKRNGLNYLSQSADNNELMPGAQVEGSLLGMPGARVSLLHNEEGPLLSDTGIGASGALAVSLNLQEGAHELQVECELEDQEMSLSTTQALMVDTTPPQCQFLDLSNGDDISRVQDEDPEHDGTQVTILFALGESNIDADDISLSLSHDDQALSVLPVEFIEANNGQGRGQVTFWGPGANILSLSAQDAAGNTCQSSLALNYL